MLGVIGYIVPEIYRFPGELAPGLKFADIPNGVDAISAIPSAVSLSLPLILITTATIAFACFSPNYPDISFG